MNILLISGDHPRHLYFQSKLANLRDIDVTSIIFKREDFIKPKNLFTNNKQKKLLSKHFEDRFKEEKKFFNIKFSLKNKIYVNKENFNKNLTDHLKKNKYKICIVFGIHIIEKKIRKLMPKNTINLHLGLSPRYRGTATLFWPFYFLEPQYAGFTFHKLGDNVDHGDILHQGVPKLNITDQIHTVACKVVIKATNDMIKIIKSHKKKKNWKFFKQKVSGKVFTTKDFHPSHLEIIYSLYKNRIVKKYLDGKLSKKKPKLVNFFKK
ncbi:formyltransferase family protein [Candidatus Pelagibacter sp.]|nr:formyltransferase family protein [Candidatus Pelagibacter sp.]